MTTLIITFLILWWIPGLIGHGYTFAYFQREYPEFAKENYWLDLLLSLTFSIFGPINLRSVFECEMDKHGIKLF